MRSGHSAVDKWVISRNHRSRTENNYSSDLEYKEMTSQREKERERWCFFEFGKHKELILDWSKLWIQRGKCSGRRCRLL